MQVNIGEAKAKFSSLVARALAGEEVVIARDNTPVLKLVPIESIVATRRPGSARGLVEIGPDFDEPLPEFEEYS
jgi:prevent-host-death family protein